MSERHACRLVDQWRATLRYRPIEQTDEDALSEAIIQLAREYGRYGYRRITVLLQEAGWHVGKDRVQRIWRREGLKVPQKQRPRGRLWFNDGSCIRLRPERTNHVWSYDFVSARTYDGRTIRMLTLIDEFTRECLAIRVARRLGQYEVIEALADVMLFRGVPEYIRSDNGSEFVAEELRKWLAKVGTGTLYTVEGRQWNRQGAFIGGKAPPTESRRGSARMADSPPCLCARPQYNNACRGVPQPALARPGPHGKGAHGTPQQDQGREEGYSAQRRPLGSGARTPTAI